MDTHIFHIEPPQPTIIQIIYNENRIVQFFYNTHFPNNIILHKIQNVLPFWMRNCYKKLYLYQLPIFYRVELPPKGMKLTILLIITLRKILLLLFPNVQYSDIPLQVRISIFRHMLL